MTVYEPVLCIVHLWVTPTNPSLLGCFYLTYIHNIYIGMWPARVVILLIVYFFSTVNSELFTCWFKSAAIPGHTKTSYTQELSSYSQKKLLFVLYLFVLSDSTQSQSFASAIFTSVSEGLLIFHSWFVCIHPILRDKYWQLYLSNVYEKYTCHWNKTGRVSWSGIRTAWGLPVIFTGPSSTILLQGN